jgi:hypothetical protein
MLASLNPICQEFDKMFRVYVVSSIVLAFFGGRTLGQGLGSSSGNIFSITPDLHNRHMGPTGKPCLAIEAYARAEVINNKIFEHWIAARNGCGMRIKVKVCYYKTDDCIVLDVPPYDRKNSVIGIYPSAGFKYETKEQF